MKQKRFFLFYYFFKPKGRKENENDSNYNSRKGNSGLGTEGKCEKVPYLRFDLAVTKGYGEGKHTVFLPCLAFQSVAQRMESAGVKKGSQIMISGDLDVVDFERRDGSKGKANKVSVYDWQFVASGKKEEKKNLHLCMMNIPVLMRMIFLCKQRWKEMKRDEMQWFC